MQLLNPNPNPDALSPLPRDCGASAHQLAAADAPCAASGADAFGCHTVALVLFSEAAAPSFGRPRVAIHEDLDAVHSGYPMFAAGASDQPPNSCQDGPGRASMGMDRLHSGFSLVTLTPLYLSDSVCRGPSSAAESGRTNAKRNRHADKSNVVVSIFLPDRF